ncbi:sulfite exporter TauE/SafE family protein [Cognatilysobacter segetis]|uniref:sulfite exporter TauE/SafE family protein n=1 Tax=Cognatilysobacter segetis TaxID=2492394 RepID=UPI001061C3C8|nr:sulfite exporter TauE/SafE family protein [Lysobacter segetis]
MGLPWLTLLSALLTGLVGSGHCAVMCGGIATGFPAMAPRAGWRYVVEPNLGRVLGYATAGAVAGGVGHAIVDLAALPGLRTGLRVATGVVMIVIGLRLVAANRAAWPYSSLGGGLWRVLKPLQRGLLPANTPGKRLALGALWGWMPCGLSTTMLTAAWLQAGAANGASTMAAFGLGTLPVMLPLTWSGLHVGRRLLQGGARTAAGALVVLAGLVTVAAPWLMAVPALHGPLRALGCLPV